MHNLPLKTKTKPMQPPRTFLHRVFDPYKSSVRSEIIYPFSDKEVRGQEVKLSVQGHSATNANKEWSQEPIPGHCYPTGPRGLWNPSPDSPAVGELLSFFQRQNGDVAVLSGVEGHNVCWARGAALGCHGLSLGVVSAFEATWWCPVLLEHLLTPLSTAGPATAGTWLRRLGRSGPPSSMVWSSALSPGSSGRLLGWSNHY